jgi:drug/metabolite transporter (DMT)-like permease
MWRSKVLRRGVLAGFVRSIMTVRGRSLNKSALAGGVTVLLAGLLLREEITINGYSGLALVIAGLIILNM